MVRQAPFGIGMVTVESFCRVFTRELLYQCGTTGMRIHKFCLAINSRGFQKEALSGRKILVTYLSYHRHCL